MRRKEKIRQRNHVKCCNDKQKELPLIKRRIIHFRKSTLVIRHQNTATWHLFRLSTVRGTASASEHQNRWKGISSKFI